MSTINLIKHDAYEAYSKKGYYSKTLRAGVLIDNHICDEVKLTRQIPIHERIGLCGIGVFCFFNFCFCCGDSEYLNDYYIKPTKGEENITLYVINEVLEKKLNQLDTEKLGFDPVNHESIVKYLEAQKDRIQWFPHLGHLYSPFYTPHTNKSKFFFLPYGKIENAKVISVWDIETHEKLNTQRLHIEAQKYCALYQPDIEVKFAVIDMPVYGTF